MIDNLIKRYLNDKVDNFKIVLECASQDFYEILEENGKIVLKGNNKISLAMAFYDYLKKYLNANITWDTCRIDNFDTLPTPKYEKKVISQKYRAYMNYCTFSYSASFWDWDRWSREIDFMAMNGINMPLFVVGLEKVWFNTLLNFGFSESEALDFLSNPAYMAWQLMNNLEGEYSPVSIEVIEKRYELGKKIMDKMISYGMTPIQQGFSGCVPKLLKLKYPNANIRIGKSWCGYYGTAQLDPLDPLFVEFGTALLNEQDKLFGSYHFYASDPFHESSPPVKGKLYLKNVAKTISSMFEKFDKDYVWIMQGWTPYKHIIKQLPKDKLIILDLSGYAYLTKRGFYGYNFIVGNLHNFGGRINLHGDLEYVASNKYMRLKKSGYNVLGTGLFMEGISQNHLYYDLTFEVLTREGEVNLQEWLKSYVRRRYGVYNDNLFKIVNLMLSTVYSKGTNNVESSSMICARPALKPKKSGPNVGFKKFYDNEKLREILLLMNENKVDCYNFTLDFTDFTRQYLSNISQLVIKDAYKCYKKRDVIGYKKNIDKYLSILDDLDKILKPFDMFSFYKWQNDAKNISISHEDFVQNIKSAKQLLTIWGPSLKNGKTPKIFDYAWREWAGLIKYFYIPRWEIFRDYIVDSMKKNAKYTDFTLKWAYGRQSFEANEIYKKIAGFERNFVSDINLLNDSYKSVSAFEIFDKYIDFDKERL